MKASAVHRIGRQSVELRADTDAEARELYTEMAGCQAWLAPVFDEVFTAACPPHLTVRIDRMEIDVGVVPREGLMAALAAATREQLASRLGRSPGFVAASSSSEGSPQILSEAEIALERVATFLDRGVAAWRDAGLTRDALEAMLLGLILSRPAALRRQLERLASSGAARRIWLQLTVPTRRRLLAWLGVADVAELERCVADWAAVLAAFDGEAGVAWRRPMIGADVGAWLFEPAWTLVLAGGGQHAADAIGERALLALTPDAPETGTTSFVEHVRAVANRVLPPHSPVVRRLARHAATREAEMASGVRRAPPEDRSKARIDPGSHMRQPDDAKASRVMPPAAGAGDGEDAIGQPGRGTAPRDGSTGSGSARSRARVAGPHAWDRTYSAVAAETRPPATRTSTRPGSEPLWVAHAGTVIVWPFLLGLFEACGLIASKRFVDDASRERAVLLTAHVAGGGESWGEHELLLEKTLCGYPIDEPIAASIDLGDRERRETQELLGSVVGHWPALKSTSIEGLRRAFLLRAGTLTAITSGRKLEIPRAGHDVLLDSLPWGIGLVLLPWMEQPLHVEW